MKTLFVFIILLSQFAWSSYVPKRDLKSLYGKLDTLTTTGKIEAENLILKDYNLLVSSATWWAGATQVENMWESLALDRLKELNIIVVYDSPRQDIARIKAKSPTTKLYEYFDQERSFYYWFSNKTLMDAVLIGPNGKILFEGILDSTEKIEHLKSIVKKKEA